MRLYEIDINSLWWVAAEDEMEAISTLRDELFSREVSEEEMDSVMEELELRELHKEEAELIDVLDDDTLWTFFQARFDSGLIYTDYYVENDEDTYDDELPYSDEFPADWL